MPAYIVKSPAGRYSVFSTVVMANITPSYATYDKLHANEERARIIASYTPYDDLTALLDAESVHESDYIYDAASDRVRLIACAVGSCTKLVRRRIGDLPPLCEFHIGQAREMLAPVR